MDLWSEQILLSRHLYLKNNMSNSKKILILASIFILNFIVIDTAFSLEKRNPFKDWFPAIKIIETEPVVEEEFIEAEPIEIFFEPEETFDPSIYTVDGLIWGSYKPKAIIDNKIYDIGDKLGEAVVTKIEKEGVILFFDDKEYLITTEKTISAEKEEKQGVNNEEMYDDEF